MCVLDIGRIFGCPISKLLLMFGQFPRVCMLVGRGMCQYVLKAKPSSHSRSKTSTTASAFCDFHENRVPPGRAVSFHQLPKNLDVGGEGEETGPCALAEWDGKTIS